MAIVKVTTITNVGRKAEMLPDTMTVREVLDKMGVNYNNTSVFVNNISCSYDLEKTLRQIVPDPAVDVFYVSSMVKADNAVSANIDGAACVVTSTLKRDDLITIAKYRPKMLTLYEETEDGREPVFNLSVCDGNGDLGAYGAVFGKRTGDNGEAKITLAVPSSEANAKQYVEDKFGGALLRIKEMEAKLGDVMTEILNEKQEIESHITVA